MATNAITLTGATLVFNSNTIGEIMSISGNRNRNINEVLSADSTDNAVEKIAGSLNEGDVTIHIVYDGSNAGVYNDLNTDFQAGTKAALLITLSDTSSFSASAIVSSLGDPSAGAGDGILELDVTFAISGKVTYTDVAA